MCPLIFYHTRFTKEYSPKNYNGSLKIYMNGHCTAVRAILDTGNRLYEPLTGKPVCLVEYGCLKSVLNSENVFRRVRLIPYHSIGKKHGVLLGITADKLIFQNHRGKFGKRGCIIGIYPGNLSRSGEFHAIIHPDLLKK
jgi:sigma-E processing peptidase SpoIIGA